MKRLTILLILIISASFIVNAQSSKRASCLNYLKYGELDKAKEACDECVEHLKTEKDSRAWWYRGQVYQAIHVSDNEKYKALSPDAADIAFMSYKKALLYNFKDPQYHSLEIDNRDRPQDMMQFIKLLMDMNTKYTSSELLVDIIQQRYPYLANILVNRGVRQFKDEKNYAKALNSFENSLFVSTMSGKIDTPIVYYAALSAEKAKEFTVAKEYFNQLTKMGYGSDEKEKATIFYLLAKVYLNEKDTANYIKTLDKGIEKYPKEPLLMVQKINWYIETGSAQEAEDMIKKAIETDQDNKLLHFNLGTIYEGKGENENAVASYKEALRIDPEYLSANYNLGAIYNNQAKDIYDECQELPMGKKYDDCIVKYDETLKKAKPFLEKAHEIDPTDKATMLSLKTIYYKTGETEKYKEIDAKLKGGSE